MKYLKTYQRFFGNKFKTAITEMSDNHELLQGHKKIQVNINRLRQKVSQELKIFRNFTAAHKDQNSLKQLEIVQTISIERIEMIGLALYGIFLQIHEYEKIFMEVAKRKFVETRNSSEP